MKLKKVNVDLIASIVSLLFGIFFIYSSFRYVYIKQNGILVNGKVTNADSSSWRFIGYQVGVNYFLENEVYEYNYHSFIYQTPGQSRTVYVLSNSPKDSVVGDDFNLLIMPLIIGLLATAVSVFVLIGKISNSKFRVKSKKLK